VNELRLVSFDPLRTWDVPHVKRVKAEEWRRELDAIREADWLLFPEQWQVNFLVYALKKRIFPSVSSYHLGQNKVEMTRAFEIVCPEHVPHTEILPRTDSAEETILSDFTFPFVAKQIRSSMGRGVYLIEDKVDFRRYVQENGLLYVQELLPIDRDLRVVVVGREVVAAYWRIAPEGGFYNNVARGGTISFEDIPPQATELVERVARDLDVDHAGFDVALVDGHPYLLEFNMRFGNEALRSRVVRTGRLVLEYLRGQA
jgi:ribosomal protein S6--L-glutamate ligase